MEEYNEKQPVDDLFARKLGNMSLPPGPDGFARLQARMGQNEREIRAVFWRNPAVQRYMAVAACLMLVCLFGWLYLSRETSGLGNATIAINKPATSSEKEGKLSPDSAVKVAANRQTPGRKTPDMIGSGPANSSLTDRNKRVAGQRLTDNRRFVDNNSRNAQKVKSAAPNIPTVVLVQPNEQIAKEQTDSPSAEPKAEKQVAAIADKPVLNAERVLVVTIAEPEALLAARRAVETSSISEKTAVATTDKLEGKAVGLWQQMKRMKQGEVFARKNDGEDERGLLGRAYSSLKHTLDKDKSVKQ